MFNQSLFILTFTALSVSLLPLQAHAFQVTQTRSYIPPGLKVNNGGPLLTDPILFNENALIKEEQDALTVIVDFTKCAGSESLPGTTSIVDGVCNGDRNASSENFEIELILQHASGVQVVLVEAGDYIGRPFGQRAVVEFKDSALNPVGPSVDTGTFQPAGSLSDFNGLNIGGPWQLSYQSLESLGSSPPPANPNSPLSINSLTITANVEVVPEPLAALGTIAAAGLGIVMKRKLARYSVE